MALLEQFDRDARDPVLEQAQTIFKQRQMRASVFDPDLLGEPGWDILLYAFIAQGKWKVCGIEDLSREIGLSEATATRWVDILIARGLIVERAGNYVTSEPAAAKLASLFKMQMAEMLSTHNLARS